MRTLSCLFIFLLIFSGCTGLSLSVSTVPVVHSPVKKGPEMVAFQVQDQYGNPLNMSVAMPKDLAESVRQNQGAQKPVTPTSIRERAAAMNTKSYQMVANASGDYLQNRKALRARNERLVNNEQKTSQNALQRVQRSLNQILAIAQASGELKKAHEIRQWARERQGMIQQMQEDDRNYYDGDLARRKGIISSEFRSNLAAMQKECEQKLNQLAKNQKKDVKELRASLNAKPLPSEGSTTAHVPTTPGQ